MNAFGMPAWKLTVDCIWNSFRSSGRKHLFLTGSKGSGKTTLLNQLGAPHLPGLTSRAIPANGVWMQENGTDRSAQIGVFDPSSSGPDMRMLPIADGFASFGLPVLLRCLAAENDWAAVDEIGYLETAIHEYTQALLSLLEKKHVLAGIRKQDVPFLQQLLHQEDAFVVDLDAPFGNIGCVIMASGMGKRFGGNKLMADFHGEPMIARCLAATADVPQRVVVTRRQEVAAYCQERGIATVLHSFPDRSDTIRLGTKALDSASAWLFSPADQPLLSRETVNSLMLASVSSPEKIWRTAFKDEPGSPVVFPAWAYPELIGLPQGKGGGFIAKKYPERVCTMPVRDGYELMDVDTPEDLRRLLDR